MKATDPIFIVPMVVIGVMMLGVLFVIVEDLLTELKQWIRNMKIISTRKPKTYKGTCQKCRCKIEASESEVKTLVDRDSPSGAKHVKCPKCGNEYLWVK